MKDKIIKGVFPFCKNEDDCKLKDQLLNAIEIADLGLWEWYIEEDYVNFDEAGYKITGIEEKSFNHTMTYLLDHVIHDESIEMFKASLSLANREGVISNSVYRINHPTKPECWLKFKSQLTFENGKAFLLSGVMLDITDDVLSKKVVINELDFIETLIESIPHPIFYKDKDGLYKFFNSAFQEFIGFKKSELLDKSVYDISPKELADVYRKADNDLLNKGGKQIYEAKVKYADQSYRDVIFTKAVHTDSDKKSLGIVGVMQDVSSQRSVEHELKRIYKANNILLDMNHRILDYYSEAQFLHDIMIKFSEIIGENLITTLVEVDENKMISIIDSYGLKMPDSEIKMPHAESYFFTLTKEDYSKAYLTKELKISDFAPNDVGIDVLEINPINDVIFIPITLENEIRWYYVFASFGDGSLNENDLIVANYIREEMNMMMQLFYLYQKTLRLSRFDGLTGLMNRQYFDETLNSSLDNLNNFNVVIFDLDKLKILNDTLGHDIGDKYLCTLSDMVKDAFNQACSFGRIGGDEFAGIILDVDNVSQKFEDLRLEFRKKMSIETEGMFETSFSYGLASYPHDGHSYKALLKTADQRMYEYKNKYAHNQRIPY
jgi:diguanylate cyclase (GGDEF)-like protein/PAS domain S-box-containing protein